jgi:hypothetical protein
MLNNANFFLRVTNFSTCSFPISTSHSPVYSFRSLTNPNLSSSISHNLFSIVADIALGNRMMISVALFKCFPAMGGIHRC